ERRSPVTVVEALLDFPGRRLLARVHRYHQPRGAAGAFRFGALLLCRSRGVAPCRRRSGCDPRALLRHLRPQTRRLTKKEGKVNKKERARGFGLFPFYSAFFPSMSGRLATFGRQLGQGLIQLLYPAICNVCGDSLLPGSDHFCLGCRATL